MKKTAALRFKEILDICKRNKKGLAIALCAVVAVLVFRFVFLSPAGRRSAQLVAPETGHYYLVLVGGEVKRVVDTPILASFYANIGNDETNQRMLSATSFGSYISIACAPGTIREDAITIYATATDGYAWVEEVIDVETSAEIDYESIFHGYTSHELGYIFLLGKNQQLNSQVLFLYKTIDGGLNWTLQGNVSNEIIEIVGAGFINENVGFICCSQRSAFPYVLVSYDGGINWQPAENIEQLLITAFATTETSFIECVSVDFVDGVRLLFVDNSTGESLAISSSDGKKWKVAR